MRRKQGLAIAVIALLSIAFSQTIARAASPTAAEEDTANRFVDAKVVEVSDSHISVYARTGVEHVIATDRTDTKFLINGEEVSLKELRVGDIVTIELDAQNQLKFAKVISLSSGTEQIARKR